MYVYIIKTELSVKRHYTGITNNLKQRLSDHNSGKCPHTSKYKPSKIKNAFWFDNPKKAFAFEKHLNSGSGRAFAKKHL